MNKTGLRFVEGEESATFTETVVNNLLGNVWQALILASIIIFLFIRKVFTSLVVVISMPLSFAITFAMMKAFDLELNMVTLSAVILAVGMVVDASVVVIENITRRRETEGLSIFEAVAVGADEMIFSVVGGVATTLVVLVPMLFLAGFTGKTFGPLSETLIYAFVSSLAVALILVPVLASYLIRDSRLDRWAVYMADGPNQRILYRHSE